MERIYTDRHSYLRAVKRCLAGSRREKARLLDTARRAVNAFLEENPHADEAAWRRNLGTPEELVAELMEGSPPGGIHSSLRRHARAVWIACALFLAVAAIGGTIGYWCWMHRDYVEVKTTIITADNESEIVAPLPTFEVEYYIGKDGED